MDLEKTYNKWQCTDIEEKYINNIEPTQFTKSELFSFAEFYHQSKFNNGVLDNVSKQSELLKAFVDFHNYRNTGDKKINYDEIEIFIDSL